MKLNKEPSKYQVYMGSEDDFQKTAVKFLSHYTHKFTHVANERKTERKQDRFGRWYSPTGNKLRQMGQSRGVPDILCFVGKNGHVGMAVELKTKSNRLTQYQKKWLQWLSEEGWYCFCTNSLDTYTYLVSRYFESKKISESIKTKLRLIDFGGD